MIRLLLLVSMLTFSFSTNGIVIKEYEEIDPLTARAQQFTNDLRNKGFLPLTYFAGGSIERKLLNEMVSNTFNEGQKVHSVSVYYKYTATPDFETMVVDKYGVTQKIRVNYKFWIVIFFTERLESGEVKLRAYNAPSVELETELENSDEVYMFFESHTK